MRLGPFLFLLPYLLQSQTASIQVIGTQGGILKPAGDSTFNNIVLGSGVTPDGKVRFSKDVFLLQSASGTIRQLTSFDNSSTSIGATAVALAPDASSAAYIGFVLSGGKQNEQVHVIDLPAGTDRVLATDLEGCVQPTCANCVAPCLHDLHYSADSRKVIWVSSQDNPFFVAGVDGSGVLRLPVLSGTLADSPNVVSNDNRLFFLQRTAGGGMVPYAIHLDGTGLAQLSYGPLTSDLVVSGDASTAGWQYAAAVSPATYYSVQTAGTVSSTLGYATTPYSSLTISANGAKAAFVHDRQVWAPQQITNFQYSDVLDVALNSAGSKLLYSTAEINSGQRAAVWLASPDGSNAKTVFGPASINPTGVIGINSQGLPLALSPGSYFTIYGRNLHGKDELLTSNITLNVLAAGISVPLQAVTPWQVNAFLPMNTPLGPLTLTLALESGNQLTYNATVAQVAPAIVTFPNSNGLQQAAAFHLSTLLPCDAQRPAHAGEVIETYGFGLGTTNPIQVAGVPAPFLPLAQTAVTPDVMVGTQRAHVLFSGLVPGLIGVYQVNITAPAIAAGDYQMSWVLGTQTPLSLGNFSIR